MERSTKRLILFCVPYVHIEELKIKRESAPLYPQAIEVRPRFTGPEVGAFAQEVGPFFDVLFPEYSLAGYRMGTQTLTYLNGCIIRPNQVGSAHLIG